MCVTSDEPTDLAGYPEVTVYAPRITGLNTEMLSSIDWAEALRLGAIGGALGSVQGGMAGLAAGFAGGALAGVESQEGVDLDELVELAYDLPVIPGYPLPNTPLY